MSIDYPAHPAANIFPLLDGEDLQALADDIKMRGLTTPVWLYDDPELGRVVLDGRNRLKACALAGVEPRTRFYIGDDPIGFSVSENLMRRHLTVGQKGMVGLEVGRLYEKEAAKRKRLSPGRPMASTEQKHEADLPHVSEPKQKQRAPQSRDLAAKAVGVSGRAMAQSKRVAEQAPDLAQKVLAGTMALDRAERVIRDRDAEQRRVEQARREASMLDVQTTIDLRLGDFRDVLAGVQGVDAIITDPPYPHEFIPLLGDLAAWADKVLKPDGILAVLMGHTYLPEVYRMLDSGRPYRWTACYLEPGAGYVSMSARVQSNWKPLIVYGGGPRFSDVIRSEGLNADAKNHHKWGQDYSAFHTIVERLTSRGQTVADPFMGSGTTLLAAHALGRNVIGAELDPEHYETAQKRLS